MATDQVRIAVLEEQALFRKALCQVLAKDERFKLLAECMEHNDIQRIAAAKPDITLLDVDFQKGDPVDSVRHCSSAAWYSASKAISSRTSALSIFLALCSRSITATSTLIRVLRAACYAG